MAKIMLVEDDNNLREIYQARLNAEGYDTVTAMDGEEALALVGKEKPDLIILDVMMPKISGFDTLDILKNSPLTKDIKVIMMTALSQAEDKIRAQKLGAQNYLVKSQVTLEDIVKAVKDALSTDGSSKSDAGIASTNPGVSIFNNQTNEGNSSMQPTDNSTTNNPVMPQDDSGSQSMGQPAMDSTTPMTPPADNTMGSAPTDQAQVTPP
ncbi:MAG TPA: response regulator, partial [Candidatus Saccharimonadia bacterium]|nr:response regulator [Candidatus Saccharimonadia bacterium]